MIVIKNSLVVFEKAVVGYQEAVCLSFSLSPSLVSKLPLGQRNLFLHLFYLTVKCPELIEKV